MRICMHNYCARALSGAGGSKRKQKRNKAAIILFQYITLPLNLKKSDTFCPGERVARLDNGPMGLKSRSIEIKAKVSII